MLVIWEPRVRTAVDRCDGEIREMKSPNNRAVEEALPLPRPEPSGELLIRVPVRIFISLRPATKAEAMGEHRGRPWSWVVTIVAWIAQEEQGCAKSGM